MTDLFSRTVDCAIMQYPRAPWTRQIPLLGLFAFINLLSISSLSAADGAKSPDDADSIATKWKTQGWPLIETFCIDCHNEDFQEAELDLSAFNSIDGLKQDESVVRKVLNMIAFGAMPPEDYDLPTDAQRNLLERVLDETHYAITCNHGPVAGRVTARRLNRTEYNNSVRDLFGMDLHPADGFPSDEVGGGFDNNADVLSLSPLQIEKYFDAAESVASQVIYDVNQFERSDLQRSTDQFVVVGNSDTGSFNGRFLDAQSWAWTEIDVKHEGKYRLVVRAGSSVKKDERDDLAVFGPDDVLVDVLSFKYYGGSGSSDSESFSMNLDRGTQRFSFVPVAALAILTGADKISDLELKVGETTFSLADHFTEDTIRAGRELVGKPLKPGRVDNEKFRS